jgi:hypothetical protein
MLVAVPVGAPPSISMHEPASAAVGALASLTVSGGVNAVQVLGAASVPPDAGHSVSMAGEARVHAMPVGLAHWHAVQPRSSSTAAKNTWGPDGYPAGHAVTAPACITHSALEKGPAGPGAQTSPDGQSPDAGADDGAHARATVVHAGAVTVAVPPVVAHEPPVAADPETVTALAPMYVVGVHDVERVCVPNEGEAQDVST